MQYDRDLTLAPSKEPCGKDFTLWVLAAQGVTSDPLQDYGVRSEGLIRVARRPEKLASQVEVSLWPKEC